MVRSSRERFPDPDDAAHFEQDQSNRKFYDPDFKSCTSFIAMIAEQRFGFDPTPVAELVQWTDIIDGALYEDAQTAVEMKAPAMKLDDGDRVGARSGFRAPISFRCWRPSRWLRFSKSHSWRRCCRRC